MIANPINEWDDDILDEATRLGDRQARALGRTEREHRAQPRYFNVSWYSPRKGGRTGFIRPIEANTAAEAKRQAKAMVTNERAVNFVAKEVKRNPSKTGKKDWAITIFARLPVRAYFRFPGFAQTFQKIQDNEATIAGKNVRRVVTDSTGVIQVAPPRVKNQGLIGLAANLQALDYVSSKLARRRNPNELARFAESDMRRARKEHAILIGQTKKGTVELSFDPGPPARYRFVSQDGGKWHVSGNARMAKQTLIDLYTIEVANPLRKVKCSTCGQTYFENTECPMCLAGVGQKRRNPQQEIKPWAVKGKYATAVITKDQGMKYVGELLSNDGGRFRIDKQGRFHKTFLTFTGAKRWAREQVKRLDKAAEGKNPGFFTTSRQRKAKARSEGDYLGRKTNPRPYETGKTRRAMSGAHVSAIVQRGMKVEELWGKVKRLQAQAQDAYDKGDVKRSQALITEASILAVRLTDSGLDTPVGLLPNPNDDLTIEAWAYDSQTSTDYVVRFKMPRQTADSGSVWKAARDAMQKKYKHRNVDAWIPVHQEGRKWVRAGNPESSVFRNKTAARREMAKLIKEARRGFKQGDWFTAKVALNSALNIAHYQELPIPKSVLTLYRKTVSEHVNNDYNRTQREARRNPSVTELAQTFQGQASGAVSQYKASDSAPENLARIGKLVFLKLRDVRRQIAAPGAMVAVDTKGKLWLVSKRAPMFTQKAASKGEALDFGEIDRICYLTAKQHIGNGELTEYAHEFGEDGGKRPRLLVDYEGMPILKGGDYKIRAEGIVN